MLKYTNTCYLVSIEKKLYLLMTSDIKIVDIGDTSRNKTGGTDQKIISENVDLSDLNVNTNIDTEKKKKQHRHLMI